MREMFIRMPFLLKFYQMRSLNMCRDRPRFSRLSIPKCTGTFSTAIPPYTHRCHGHCVVRISRPFEPGCMHRILRFLWYLCTPFSRPLRGPFNHFRNFVICLTDINIYFFKALQCAWTLRRGWISVKIFRCCCYRWMYWLDRFLHVKKLYCRLEEIYLIFWASPANEGTIYVCGREETHR